MNITETNSLIYIISSLNQELDAFQSVLFDHNYKYVVTTSFKGALELFEKKVPDMLLVDLDYHAELFSEYCFSIKSNPKFSEIKIIFLSTEGRELKELQALNAGADDYIQKPVAANLLFKRIQIRLSSGKTKEDSTNKKEKERFYMDVDSFAVFVNNLPVEVSKKEFELLQYMSSNPGKVFTRAEIFENVWKRKPNENERTLDVHILRLRKKLGEHFISTQKGVGYRFRP